MKSFSFVPISTAIIVSLTLLHNSAYATDQSYMPATQSQQSQADQNKSAGEAFLAANKKNSGVVELPDGLQYKVITQGTGPIATPKDTVTVDYAGTLINGKEFDSSYKRGEPISFPVSGVIPGWVEALKLMQVGSTWQLFIPSSLAYGEQGAPPSIGPNETLIFNVHLIAIQH